MRLVRSFVPGTRVAWPAAVAEAEGRTAPGTTHADRHSLPFAEDKGHRVRRKGRAGVVRAGLARFPGPFFFFFFFFAAVGKLIKNKNAEQFEKRDE
jgi:hypothetical protein